MNSRSAPYGGKSPMARKIVNAIGVYDCSPLRGEQHSVGLIYSEYVSAVDMLVTCFVRLDYFRVSADTPALVLISVSPHLLDEVPFLWVCVKTRIPVFHRLVALSAALIC